MSTLNEIGRSVCAQLPNFMQGKMCATDTQFIGCVVVLSAMCVGGYIAIKATAGKIDQMIYSRQNQGRVVFREENIPVNPLPKITPNPPRVESSQPNFPPRPDPTIESFFESVSKGNLEEVKRCISFGIDVNSKFEGRGALHEASAKGNDLIVKELLNSGAKTEMVNRNDQTPLHLACIGGYDSIIGQLIKSGKNLNSKDDKGNTPLIYAIVSNNMKCFEECMNQEGIDIDIENDNHETALSLVASLGNSKMIQTLLEKKGMGEKKEALSETKICRFLGEGEISFTDFLQNYFSAEITFQKYDSVKIENGEKNLSLIKEGFSKLSLRLQNLIRDELSHLVKDDYLRKQNKKDAIEKILANPYGEMETSDGKRMFFGIALLNLEEKMQGNPSQTLESSQEFKSCLDTYLSFASDDEVNQAFHIALKRDDFMGVEDLLKTNRIHLNVPNTVGEFPLLIAASQVKQKPHLLKRLLEEENIDLSVIDKKGNSVAHFVAEAGNVELLEILKAKGGSFKLPNNEMVFPLQRALESEKENCIEFFLNEHQEDINGIEIDGLKLFEYAVVHSIPSLRKSLRRRGITFDSQVDKEKLIKRMMKECLTVPEWTKAIIEIKELDELRKEIDNLNTLNEEKEHSELFDKFKVGIGFFLELLAVEESHRSKGTNIEDDGVINMFASGYVVRDFFLQYFTPEIREIITKNPQRFTNQKTLEYLRSFNGESIGKFLEMLKGLLTERRDQFIRISKTEFKSNLYKFVLGQQRDTRALSLELVFSHGSPVSDGFSDDENNNS